jgi:hypothetical protein
MRRYKTKIHKIPTNPFIYNESVWSWQNKYNPFIQVGNATKELRTVYNLK